MKFRTTRKAIVNGSARIVYSGYCELSNLLRNHSPIAYTCGVYGWNYDVYVINGLTVCTGYRGMPGRYANNIIEYEAKARLIMDEYSKPYEERAAAVEKLLHEWIAQA
uniref:Uncharacterized protein n=1 Tax=Caudovirales sp. ctrNG92 TaxID=2827638 RepID=A0A8S5SE89_9CAUD|nr:MAG TPA: hypothetical protein [Caudovirales sp. ctrNG92]